MTLTRHYVEGQSWDADVVIAIIVFVALCALGVYGLVFA